MNSDQTSPLVYPCSEESPSKKQRVSRMDEGSIGVEFMDWLESKGSELEKLRVANGQPVLTFDGQRVVVADLSGDKFSWFIEMPPGHPTLSDSCCEPLFKVSFKGRKAVQLFPPPDNVNPKKYIEELLPWLFLSQITDSHQKNSVLEFLCQSCGKSKLELTEEFSRHGSTCLDSLQCAKNFTEVLQAIFQLSVAWSFYRRVLLSHVSTKESGLMTISSTENREDKTLATSSSIKGPAKKMEGSDHADEQEYSSEGSDSDMRPLFCSSWGIFQAQVKHAAQACVSASQAVTEAARSGAEILAGIFHDYHSRFLQSIAEPQTRGKLPRSQIIGGVFPRSMKRDRAYSDTISNPKRQKIWSDDDDDEKIMIMDRVIDQPLSKPFKRLPKLKFRELLKNRMGNFTLKDYKSSRADETGQSAGTSLKFGEECDGNNTKSNWSSPSREWTKNSDTVDTRVRKIKIKSIQSPSPPRTITSKVAIEEGDILHWCSIEMGSKSRPFSCTIQLHGFVHEVVALVIGITIHKPLHLRVSLGEDLVGYDAVWQCFPRTVGVIAQQPGEVSLASKSSAPSTSSNPQSGSKSMGLSFLIPHIVTEHFRQHIMQRDLEHEDNLFIELLQTIVRRLANLTTSCPVCGDRLKTRISGPVKGFSAPRSCEKNLCISLFTLWSQLAPLDDLSDYTPVSFLRLGGVVDLSREEELKQLEFLRQEVLARNMFPNEASSIAQLNKLLQSAETSTPPQEQQGPLEFEFQGFDQLNKLDTLSYYDKIKEFAKLWC